MQPYVHRAPPEEGTEEAKLNTGRDKFEYDNISIIKCKVLLICDPDQI